MTKKNERHKITLSEQFQNAIEKLLKEVKLIHLTQTHDSSLSTGTQNTNPTENGAQ